MSQIGERLAAVRGSRGMTIRSLAAEAGISAGFISQLERGRGNPSFVTMMKICQVLDVPIGTFFTGDDSRSSAGVVRADHRRRLIIPPNDVEYDLLTPSLHGRLGVYQTRLPPGFSAEALPIRHEGEEFVTIIEGEAIMHVGGIDHHLAAGDSITFDSLEPHWGANPGVGTVVAIVCMTPPSI